jgi:hypothetical protein
MKINDKNRISEVELIVWTNFDVGAKTIKIEKKGKKVLSDLPHTPLDRTG